MYFKGRNVEENAHVKMGAYHTIDVEPNRKFTLIKAEWDSVSLDRIDMATDPARSADVAAVVMQEGDYVFLLRVNHVLVYPRVKPTRVIKPTCSFQA